MDTSRLLRTTGTVIAAAGLLLSGCTSGGSGTPRAAASSGGAARATSAEPTAVPAALRPYYDQKLSWRECGVPGFECTTMKVPLDYENPGAGTSTSRCPAARPPTPPSGSAPWW